MGSIASAHTGFYGLAFAVQLAGYRILDWNQGRALCILLRKENSQPTNTSVTHHQQNNLISVTG